MTSWIKQHILNSLHQSRNMIVILRHAHRFEIGREEFGNDETITLEGKKAAERLGSSLAGIPLGEVHTSPILRCVQTTEELLRGARQKIQINSSTMLGNPGPFVADSEEAGPIFLKNPLQEIAKNVVEGKKRIPGMRSLAEGGQLFLDYALKVKSFPCLMITHDIVICLLCCFFFTSMEVQKYFPGFLEGFALNIDSERISIFYRDEISYYFLRDCESSKSNSWISLPL